LLGRRTGGDEGRQFGGKTEVGEDLGNDRGIFDGREESEAAAASGARQHVVGKNSSKLRGPDCKNPVDSPLHPMVRHVFAVPERSLYAAVA
jgi:hypothetical protein